MWTLRSLRKDQGRHARAAVLLQLVRWQAEPLQPVRINSGAESCLQLGVTPCRSRGLLLKKVMTVREACTGAVQPWEDSSPSPGRPHSMEGTHACRDISGGLFPESNAMLTQVRSLSFPP